MRISSRSISQAPIPKASAQNISRVEDFVLKQQQNYFDRWDLDHNGQISWSEMRQNVADSHIRGEESVSLATLYGLMEHDAAYRGLQRKPPVTYNRLYDLYYDYDNPDTGELAADYFYQKYAGKLEEAGSELFGESLPDGYAAKQGAAPSCGFLAATFATVWKEPAVAKKAIVLQEDGDYEVQFPGLRRPIEVAPPTDTERALFSTAQQNGTWITVLEKAWGKHQAGGDELRAFEMDTNPEDAIRAWTNGSAKTTRVAKNPKEYKKGEIPFSLKTAYRALAEDRTVVAWTRFEDVSSDDYVVGHAYTVTGIHPEEGSVSLRNPWGHQEPLGDDGKPLDKKDDGLFEISFQQFHKNFKMLARQTG